MKFSACTCDQKHELSSFGIADAEALRQLKAKAPRGMVLDDYDQAPEGAAVAAATGSVKIGLTVGLAMYFLTRFMDRMIFGRSKR